MPVLKRDDAEIYFQEFGSEVLILSSRSALAETRLPTWAIGSAGCLTS